MTPALDFLTPWGLREFYGRPSSRAMVGSPPHEEDMGEAGSRLNALACQRESIYRTWGLRDVVTPQGLVWTRR